MIRIIMKISFKIVLFFITLSAMDSQEYKKPSPLSVNEEEPPLPFLEDTISSEDAFTDLSTPPCPSQVEKGKEVQGGPSEYVCSTTEVDTMEKVEDVQGEGRKRKRMEERKEAMERERKRAKTEVEVIKLD